MDEADLAQGYETMFREEALREHFRRRDNAKGSRSPGLHPAGAGPGQRRICSDCGEEIGEARLRAIPDADRCIGCQKIAEEKGLL